MAAGDSLGPGIQPFVLTLEMDGESFARFEELRRRYYPPERNLVPAHVTLFHQLPGDRAREVKALIGSVCRSHPVMALEVAEVKALERGVAVFLRSARLMALRDYLAGEWWTWLGDPDRAGFRPHVTVQNNVDAATARATQRGVNASRLPRNVRGIGLHLWRYRGGPWEDVQLYRFR